MGTSLKRYGLWLAILMAVWCVSTCKKQIPTQEITGVKNYLVVSGNINPSDTTIIYLSRLVSVTDSSQHGKPELNAKLTIEGQQGGSYPLTEAGKGNYTAPALNLSTSQSYRLHISTSDGKEYASDYVPVKNSPPIDTINYATSATDLKINANTHDASNNTRYYRWDYTETYIIHEPYYSHYKTVDHDTILVRAPDEQVYECWVTDTSSTIVLGTSINLSQDVIAGQVLTTLPSSSEKVHIRYSIMVKQYALTPDAYSYFTLLKKNTEDLGSIFDAQPSALTGNVHCLSDQESVIGYITAGAVAQKRVFIDSSNLPGWTASLPYGSCTLDTLLYFREVPTTVLGAAPMTLTQVYDLLYPGTEDPVDKVGDYPSGGFTGSFPICVDCSLRGTNKKPSFWK